MSSKKILWVTDPWDQLIHKKETTLRWIEAGAKLGQESYWCDVQSIRIQSGESRLEAKKVLDVQSGHGKEDFKFDTQKVYSPKDFDQIHYRVDPPVDTHYLHPLQILALETRDTQTEFINPLDMLFKANEKFENFLLPNLTPPTLVSSQKNHFLAFWKENKSVVVKPIFDARGRGTDKLVWDHDEDQKRATTIFENLTLGHRSPALTQGFIEGIHDGEIRLWYLDGELLTQFRKFPDSGDFRVNVTGGSRIEKTELNPEEKKASEEISKLLIHRKIRLAAIDLIQGKCTDFNFTSPGLMVQMEELHQTDFSTQVLKKLEKPFSN